MRVLHIFDFDDTLVRSESNVLVYHEDGTTSELSSEEYAKYKKQPGDVMDFSEFDIYPINPEIIEGVFAELLNSISTDGLDSVVVLTARGNIEPVMQFFEDNGLTGLTVVGTGSSNPMDKARFVLDKVNSGNYSMVRVFEDNVKNIRSIKRVINKDGSARIQTNRVSNGRVVNSSVS